MKKRFTIILTAILCMFLTTNIVSAATKVVCDPEVEPGKNFNCIVTIDNENDEVKLQSTKVKISGIGTYSITMNESGNVAFGPASESEDNYTIKATITTSEGTTTNNLLITVKKV